MPLFKAFIRVVKSLRNDSGGFESFGDVNIVDERMIEAADKDGVKQFLLEKYPQFFPTLKVYEKETKDQAQFFYVVIFPLYNHEVKLVEEGSWECCQCGQVYENKYLERPRTNYKLFPDKLFCDVDVCVENFKKEYYKDVELPDNEYHINKTSPNYIYKVTEKATGKSYVGKTRNAPFFRWWDHLKRSSSPFGLYLQSTQLSEWSFEVLQQLPPETSDSEVFRIESEFIVQYNCINNGFNSLISNKSVQPQPDPNQLAISYTNQ